MLSTLSSGQVKLRDVVTTFALQTLAATLLPNLAFDLIPQTS